MEKKKLSTEQKKSQLLIFLLSVAAIVMLVFCINAVKDNSSQPAVADTTTAVTAATTTTTLPSTTAPATTEATEATSAPAPSEAPESTTAAPVEDETEEILRVVTEAVKSLKSDTANFSGHKVQNIDMKLIDSSMPAMNDFVNGILGVFIKQEVYDYEFVNGVATDPESGGTSKSNSIFPPGDCEFRLVKEGIASAEKKQDGENTVYTIVIVAETSTLENPRPPHHNSAADTLDLSGIEIPVAKITKADFEYPGATISVTINPQGQVICYYERLPIRGTGEAKALGLTGFGTIDGHLEEKWDIQWK